MEPLTPAPPGTSLAAALRDAYSDTDELRQQVGELRAQLAMALQNYTSAVEAQSTAMYDMGRAKFRVEVKRLRAQLADARTALEPFVKAFQEHCRTHDDNPRISKRCGPARLTFKLPGVKQALYIDGSNWLKAEEALAAIDAPTAQAVSDTNTETMV